MTPKEKAEELFVKFNKEGMHQIAPVINRFVRREMQKQCALICINEMIRVAPWGGVIDGEVEQGSKEYYIQVKQEIENGKD